MKRKRPHNDFVSNADNFLANAQRYFNKVTTLRNYIIELNKRLPDTSPGVCLEVDGEETCSSYTRLIDRVYIAWPSEPIYATEAVEGLINRGIVSIDQVVTEVISASFRQHPSQLSARFQNVLCNGFSLGSQYGHGSIFRGLDAQTTSAQVQMLRSPPWKELFHHLGHVAMRHLLMNAVILMAIPEQSSNMNLSEADFSSVFLQICGPCVTQGKKFWRPTSRRSRTNIVLRQDVLYRTPTYRKSGLQSFSHGKEVKGEDGKNRFYNDGLPRSHHMQGLEPLQSSKYLLKVIFMHGDKGCREQKSLSRAPAQAVVYGYDHSAYFTSWESSRPKRGKMWLRTRRKFPKRLTAVLPFLEKVIRRTHSYSFRRILGKHCALEAAFWQRSKRRHPYAPAELIRMRTQPKNVALFLVACCRQMFPKTMFGCLNNRFVFEKGVHTFVRQRLRGESFDVRRYFLQSGMKVSGIPWLYLKVNNDKISNPTDLEFRKRHLEDFLTWIFRGVLISILNQNFYLTEGDSHKNRVFFYRREVWVRLLDSTIGNMLGVEKRFKQLSTESLASYTLHRDHILTRLRSICSHRVLMYHEMRFVPKKNSLRGIQKPRGTMIHGFFQTNKRGNGRTERGRCPRGKKGTVSRARMEMKSMMKNILLVISFESQKAASMLGASVFSMDDIYERVLRLKRSWLNSNRPKMYITCVDITKSFDTIPLKTLLFDVIPVLFKHDRYVILRFGVSKLNFATGRTSFRISNHVCSEAGEETSFVRVIKRKLSSQHQGSVFTDLAQKSTLRRDDILVALQEFLMNNAIAVPRRSRKRSHTGFALQTQGLPQGHTLSPLLTSLFYAHVEAKDLLEFSSCHHPEDAPGGITHSNVPNLLMRLVDDTVFFTADAEKAVQFVHRMVKGWKSTHGFAINADKTRSNFAAGVGGIENLRFMPWCGFLLDTKSLEVRADYNRYKGYENGRIRDSLLIEHDWQPGRLFAERAWSCFKPKVHALLLDGQINSRQTVALNVYQAGMLSALKLCSYAFVILPKPNFMRDVLRTSLAKYVSLIHRSVSCNKAASHECRLPLSPVEVQYLAIHAFSVTVRKRLVPGSRLGETAKVAVNELDSMLDDIKGSVGRQRDVSILVMTKAIERSSKWMLSFRL